MCTGYGYYHITDDEIQQMGVDPDQLEIEFQGKYVIRPSNMAPVVWNDPEDGKRKMELFSFGMIPAWNKDSDPNQWRYANARDDKLQSSRLWKPRFESKRCLIPANGFFEPHRLKEKITLPEGPKPTDSVPFYFKLKSIDQFAFAGIYDGWTNPETGELIRSYSIITGEPNEQIKKIHNKRPRQPVILHPEDYDFWLDQEANPKDYFGENIFEPWPDDDMEHWQVTKQYDYGERSEKALQPVNNPIDLNNPEGQQKSLF